MDINGCITLDIDVHVGVSWLFGSQGITASTQETSENIARLVLSASHGILRHDRDSYTEVLCPCRSDNLLEHTRVICSKEVRLLSA